MKTVRTHKRASALVAMLAAAGVAAAPAAEAQLAPVIHGSTEIDTEGFQILVLGAGLTRAGLGLHPSVAVVGYHLRDSYAGGPTVSENAVAPMVGLRQQWQTGAVSAHLGYLFTDGDGPFPGSPGGGDDGVLTSLQANYWSPAGTNAQAIASYNWESNYVWTNLRGAQRLGPAVELASPAFAVGAEAQFQGALEQEAGYRAFQAGAVGEVHLSPALRLIGVVGGKTDNRALSPEVFPYFKVEFVAFP